VVAVTVLGSAIAAIDSTVVGIALPAIGRNFHMSVSSLQWVVSAYLLALAGLLLVGGALGDRFGRRRVFIIGVVSFALTSLVCAAAPNSGLLITGRALQGVGAALLTPGSLAILRGSFTADDQGAAIGAWSGLGGVATAIGPFLGGFLISAVSWRLIFLINFPISVVVVVMAARHVPESTDPTAGGRVDLLGALLVSAGLVGLTAGKRVSSKPDRRRAVQCNEASKTLAAGARPIGQTKPRRPLARLLRPHTPIGQTKPRRPLACLHRSAAPIGSTRPRRSWACPVRPSTSL